MGGGLCCVSGSLSVFGLFDLFMVVFAVFVVVDWLFCLLVGFVVLVVG